MAASPTSTISPKRRREEGKTSYLKLKKKEMDLSNSTFLEKGGG